MNKFLNKMADALNLIAALLVIGGSLAFISFLAFSAILQR